MVYHVHDRPARAKGAYVRTTATATTKPENDDLIG